MKEIKINIPSEFTIDHYNKLGEFEHLSDLEKTIRVISVITDNDEEFVKTWDIGSIQGVYNEIHQKITNTQAVFLPIFEFEGIKYGIQPISKMSAGEYIDLDSKLQKGDVLDVMSIIYRPITEYKFDSLKWKIRNNLKFIQGKAENLFKYYSVEDYDTEKREWRKDIFKNLPMGVALGAYNFFLLIEIQLSNATLQSSPQVPEKMKKEMKEGMENLFKNISDGSIPYTLLQKTEGFSDLQEKRMLRK